MDLKMPQEQQSGGENEAHGKDPVISIIGEFGRWQCLLLLPIFLMGMPSAWQVLVMSFLSMDVDFWCQIDGAVGDPSRWESIASPQLLDSGARDKCNIYDVDYSQLDLNTTDHQSVLALSGNRTRECSSWSFDDSNQIHSIISQFELVCGKAWYVTLTQSTYMFGFLCGVFVSGLLSDRFGRRRVLMGSSIISVTAAVACSFSPNVVVFMVLRAVVGATNSAAFTVGFVYGMELVGGKWKTIIGLGLEMPWALAYSLLPGIAYLIRSWKYLQLSISVPMLVFPFCFYLMPESPRWLLSNHRLSEAKAVLQKAVTLNRSTTCPEDIQVEPMCSAHTKSNLLDLLKMPELRRKTLLQMYLWFSASFVYYGLTLNADSLIPGDLYLNTAISGLLEFPAYILSALMLHWIGRRSPQSAMFLLGGAALLINLAMDSPGGKNAMSQIGKFGVTCAFAMIFVYAAELYPTVVRSTGLGICSFMARIGAILAPIIGREVGRANQTAAIIFFGLVSLLAGFLTLLLPETRNRKLPDTLEEGEQISVLNICSELGKCRSWIRRKLLPERPIVTTNPSSIK